MYLFIYFLFIYLSNHYLLSNIFRKKNNSKIELQIIKNA